MATIVPRARNAPSSLGQEEWWLTFNTMETASQTTQLDSNNGDDDAEASRKLQVDSAGRK